MSRARVRKSKKRSVPFSKPPREAVLAEAPLEQLEAVLAEGRLAAEHGGRHAPVAGGFEALLVRRDARVELGFARARLGLERGEVEAGARGGFGEVRALVPALHLAAPEQVRDLEEERQAAAALGGEG